MIEESASEAIIPVATNNVNAERQVIDAVPDEDARDTIETVEEQPELSDDDTDNGGEQSRDMVPWWRRPRDVIMVVPVYIKILGMLTFFFSICFIEALDKDLGRKPKVSATDSVALLPLPENSRVSHASARGSVQTHSTTATSLGKLKDTLCQYARLHPRFISSFLIAPLSVLVIKYGAPPRPVQDVCASRSTDDGFVGNPDLYGLGIRLGIYVQWVAATIGIKFVPSARSFIISSYLFTQFGLLVALCMLLAPGSCTFQAEVSLTLLFLWAGSAIVFIPTQKANSDYNYKSRYFLFEVLTVLMGVLVFMFSFWFHLRDVSDQSNDDFAHTPNGSWTFWLGPVAPDRTGAIVWITQPLYIALALMELLDLMLLKPKEHRLNNLTDWNWSFSAAMTTGAMSKFCYVIFAGFIMFFTVSQAIFTFHRDIFLRLGDEKPSLLADVLLYLPARIAAKCYWLIRQGLIIFWAFVGVEYLLQMNNVEGVRNLGSTGQVLPLAIGVATLLAVLFMWVKDFFKQERGSKPETTPLVLEQAIGFPTASGTWI